MDLHEIATIINKIIEELEIRILSNTTARVMA